MTELSRQELQAVRDTVWEATKDANGVGTHFSTELLAIIINAADNVRNQPRKIDDIIHDLACNDRLDKLNDIEDDIKRRLAEYTDQKIVQLLEQDGPAGKLYDPHNCLILFDAIRRPAIADQVKPWVASFNGNNFYAPKSWCKAHHAVVTSWQPDGLVWTEAEQAWVWEDYKVPVTVV